MEYELKTIPECDLGFVELNPTQTTTLIYLHGAFGSPTESSLFTPYLQDYHVLIPALHGNIKQINPRIKFSMEYVCPQVSILIQQKAKNNQAHVFGFSMGASVALNLAMQHPESVVSVIASGVGSASRFPWWKRAAFPSFIYAQSILPRRILSKQRQAQAFNYAIRPASDDLAMTLADEPFEGDWELCKEICSSLMSSMPPGKPIVIQPPCLLIVGTATVGDSVADLKYTINAIRKSGGTAEGCEIKDGGHPWILQLPVLCAEILKAWIEHKELPSGATKVEAIQTDS